MIKKIATYFLLILFAASTTSLPEVQSSCKMENGLSGHYCPLMNSMKLNNKKTVLDTKCGSPDNICLTKDRSCCNIKLIDNSIKDSYEIHEVKINLHNVYQYLDADIHMLYLYESLSSEKITFNDTSPDTRMHTPLFISNSVFLI